MKYFLVLSLVLVSNFAFANVPAPNAIATSTFMNSSLPDSENLTDRKLKGITYHCVRKVAKTTFENNLEYNNDNSIVTPVLIEVRLYDDGSTVEVDVAPFGILFMGACQHRAKYLNRMTMTE